VGKDDSNGERLMTDYHINGDVDGHTWFRGRHVLLEKISHKERAVGELYFL
jgi:hypothetical protein